MTELLLSFISWVKDPFHRKEITTRHNILLQQMYAAEVIAHERSKEIRKGNLIDRTVRGTPRT